ncbi:DUF2304 domain-containing protein [Xylanimonas allomyrinae]|uniref:DUF2304 domain-containing protein n=1 Tax=Xylanimonas allomyrinae TaxID=2509459 RepID=A0A4P6ENR4_9MICO|nr:DUF2304 domain-containing protein [Xylanimonas allomyrinae]QAY63373.1 DUF2304 domain-containing protein [Xylanimonas allomyrinae]
MLSQILLVAGMVVVTFLLGRITTSSRNIAFRRLFLIAFLVVAVLAILFPSWVQALADLVGIGRGTDLVLYVLVVVFVGSLAMNSRRATEGARRTTLLARAVAIENAERDFLTKDSAR